MNSENPDYLDEGDTENGPDSGRVGPEMARPPGQTGIERPVRKIRKGAPAGNGRTPVKTVRELEEELQEEAKGAGKKEMVEKEEEEKKKPPARKKRETPREMAIGIGKDVGVSALIVGGLLLVLYLYSGVWPPMVVIESSSMMHGEDSQIGVIDTGDLTLVQKVDDRSDIVTYVEATCRTDPNHGLKEYGDYGNVIVYRKNGRAETPVIHRAIAWIEYNASASRPGAYRGDIPDIGVYNVSEYYLNITSYRPGNYLKQERLVIQIAAILGASSKPHSGFVTKGDHNIPYVDQWVLYVEGGKRVEPVKTEWIVGKAQGELPWFGLFKLWISGHDSRTFPPSSTRNLIITIVILVIVPIIIDYFIAKWKEKKENRKEARKKVRKLRFR